MKVVPLIKCRDIDESIKFYTSILGFDLVGRWPSTGSLAYSIITKGEIEINLSTHSGDGAFENDLIIIVENVDEVFQTLLANGLDTSHKRESPVHQTPLDQTWGTRELYVDDPSGNTIRFIQRSSI
jgi:catechol 2,3-dioxygenase-like lactoylglutathione lyase family enzyme